MPKLKTNEYFNIRFRNLRANDIPELTSIMKEAFDEDTRMHTPLTEDGPKGYDDGALLEQLLKMPHSESEVILADEKMIGAYTIVKSKECYTLEMLFIAPTYSSFGIGKRVWEHVEHRYSEAPSWIVETPDYSIRNHHFYEKCGFTKLRETIFDDGSKSVVFGKDVTVKG